MVDVNPSTSIEGYNDMAVLSARKGDLTKTVENFRKALAYNERSDFKRDMSNVHFSLGLTLQKLGQNKEASTELNNAVREYEKALAKSPDSIETLVKLGNTVAVMGDFDQAISYFKKAVNLNPTLVENHIILIQALDMSGQFDAAIEAANKAQNFIIQNGRTDIAAKLQQLMSAIRAKQ